MQLIEESLLSVMFLRGLRSLPLGQIDRSTHEICSAVAMHGMNKPETDLEPRSASSTDLELRSA
jgi:hypothetical protein